MVSDLHPGAACGTVSGGSLSAISGLNGFAFRGPGILAAWLVEIEARCGDRDRSFHW
jgi:hypothetical protein